MLADSFQDGVGADHVGLDKRPRSIDYIEILETYITNRYNISKTASDIHVHRNTMNHYLEKIQTLIPVDMTVPENMLRIQMGLYAAHILDLERSEAPSSERIDSNAGFTG